MGSTIVRNMRLFHPHARGDQLTKGLSERDGKFTCLFQSLRVFLRVHFGAGFPGVPLRP